MKFATKLSVPFIVAGLVGAASAAENGPFSLGDGPFPPVGEEVWRLVTPPANPSTTRAQVLANLREAQRLGQISTGEDAFSFLDAPMASSTTRAQVVAELREAQRLGLVNTGGEGDIKVATPEQERLITLAGRRAIGGAAVVKR